MGLDMGSGRLHKRFWENDSWPNSFKTDVHVCYFKLWTSKSGSKKFMGDLSEDKWRKSNRQFQVGFLKQLLVCIFKWLEKRLDWNLSKWVCLLAFYDYLAISRSSSRWMLKSSLYCQYWSMGSGIQSCFNENWFGNVWHCLLIILH